MVDALGHASLVEDVRGYGYIAVKQTDTYSSLMGQDNRFAR